MKSIKLFEVIGAIVIVSLTAFAGISCAQEANADKLAGVTWVLKSYGDIDNLQSVVSDKETTLTFDKEKQEISGNGGVNGYGGYYEADGNKLTVKDIIHTLMAGPEPLMNQEIAFFNILQSAQSFDIDGQELTITETEGVLKFGQK
jgi:heat shock protein HslJ